MRHLRWLLTLALLLGPALAGAQPRPSPDEFVPISEIPTEEQIPAVNLVAAAYAFVWVTVLGYVWSLGSRLRKTEDEIARLERKAQ